MSIDSVNTEREPVGDVVRAAPLGKQLKHLSLPSGQLVEQQLGFRPLLALPRDFLKDPSELRGVDQRLTARGGFDRLEDGRGRLRLAQPARRPLPRPP